MTRLTRNLTSKYFEASQRIQGLSYHLVRVFVEGYDDVSFWRSIFNEFETEKLKFEISVPVRGDLAKGKKVVMALIPESGKNLILCVDSDFDFLFGSSNEQSQLVNTSKFLFQTYAYATENYVCYPPSLHSLCVKSTKNDKKIFDFEVFMNQYSQTIYPLFLWYALSARKSTQKAFPLADFKNAVRLNYIDLKDNGQNTLLWLARQVAKRRVMLERKNGEWINEFAEFERSLQQKGVTQDNIYLFMQGHTLKDNVVLVLLQAVCEKLREINNAIIMNSERRGLSLKNELSNYNNSLRNIKEVLADNEYYKDCFLYHKLLHDIELFIKENTNKP